MNAQPIVPSPPPRRFPLQDQGRGRPLGWARRCVRIASSTMPSASTGAGRRPDPVRLDQTGTKLLEPPRGSPSSRRCSSTAARCRKTAPSGPLRRANEGSASETGRSSKAYGLHRAPAVVDRMVGPTLSCRTLSAPPPALVRCRVSLESLQPLWPPRQGKVVGDDGPGARSPKTEMALRDSIDGGRPRGSLHARHPPVHARR